MNAPGAWAAWLYTPLLVVLLAAPVLGLDCLTDNAPFIHSTTRPVALCVIADPINDHCYTYLSNPDNSSDIWGSMPDEPYRIEGVGKVDYYLAINNVASVGFSRDRLLHNRSVQGNIVCGNEAYAFNFTPQFTDFQEPVEAGLWIKANALYLLAALFGAFFILLFIAALIRAARRG